MLQKTNQKNKVFVLMSGGVDSSVAAALLKHRGYNLCGIHLKISEFCDEKDEYDSRRVCEILDIPFYVIDISAEYRKTVISDMLKNYIVGFTPNPDVLCNKLIKFGYVFDKLSKMQFDYIATGHYAKICQISNWRNEFNKFISPRNRDEVSISGKSQNYCSCIYTAKDLSKDQTYFLWGIKKKRLKKILFPIGDYLKKEVRQLAKKFNLPNADKKDSQGICFLGKISLNDYLSKFLSKKKGKILDTEGNVLAEHSGHWFFTEGQRHGLGIKTGGGPYFVVKKDPKKNLIIAAKSDEKILYIKQIELKNLNWLVDFTNYLRMISNASRIFEKNSLSFGKDAGVGKDLGDGCNSRRTRPIREGFRRIKVLVRCRYRQPLTEAMFEPAKNLLTFKIPQKAIAPGQSAVFYLPSRNRHLLLGGGMIKRVKRKK
jgi:tRNA-specific 2-thiouridylase